MAQACPHTFSWGGCCGGVGGVTSRGMCHTKTSRSPQGFCTTSRYHTPATCLSVLVVRIQVFGVHASVYFVGNLQQAQSLRPQLPTTLTHHTTLIIGQHEQD
jgi:hypothetical protein